MAVHLHKRAKDELRRGARALIETPVGFARGVLGDDLWGKQEEILDSVAKYPLTAVKACHSSGKTHVAARAALWWVARFRDGICITTAPTWNQVRRVMWGQIHQALEKSWVKFPHVNQTEICLGPSNYLAGLSTSEGVNFQGFHGKILIILDEAPGINPDIWEAIEGIRAGGDVRLLALGNPTVASGPFFECFKPDSLWNRITISAFDTPNFRGIDMERLLEMSEEEIAASPREYLTTRRWVRERWHQWGPDHRLWVSRVLGEFAEQDADSLYSLAWLSVAKQNAFDPDPTDRWYAGLDIAGPGQAETALCIRRGQQIVGIWAWQKEDPRQEVLDVLRPFRDRGIVVQGDAIGQGHYFLRDLEKAGYPVAFVNVGLPSSEPKRFASLKAEIYWELRDTLQANQLAFPKDRPMQSIVERTIGQLSTVRFTETERGQVIIESKESLARRGVASPDLGEAVILCFAKSAKIRPRSARKVHAV
ncbi:hypothetical protein K2Z84_05255 [Candidatus Binatia bacterium]|nr:hypothetical protein [Candidatus Binatia bacterium]